MRSKIVLLVIFLLYLLLICRIYDLSIVSYKKYNTLSRKNYTKIIPIAPVRGIIYDRNAKVIALNQLRFNVAIVPHLKAKELNETIDDISQVLDINKTDVYSKYIKNNSAYNNRPVPVILFLKKEAVFKAEPILSLNPDILFQITYMRYYPYKFFLSNILGYVSRANADDLKRNDVIKYTNTSGKRGIEKYYDNILQGELGYKKVLVNARNKILKIVKNVQPKTHNIKLSIDTTLQKHIYDLLTKENKKGAVIVMKTDGEILALVSTPSYDNNLFVKGISFKAWEELSHNIYNPLLNKPVSGLYPPGSIIKPAIALIAASSGRWNPWKKIECPGYIVIGNRKFRDWRPWGHGKTDIIKAIKESVDTYFYQVGLKIGINYIAKNLKRMGFGKKTDIDLPNEKKGIIPNKKWKEKKYHQPWFIGETLNASIGQGYMLVTPLQVAVNTALIASGKLPKPFIVMQVDNNKTKPFIQDILTVKEKKALKFVRLGMWEVCNAPGGTATNHINTPFQIAGKTGTAQVYSIPQKVKERKREDELKYFHRSHAWLTTYGPYKHPQFIVTVLIEHGGHGGSAAGGIVNDIYEFLYTHYYAVLKK